MENFEWECNKIFIYFGMPQVLTAVKFVQKLRQSAEILCHCLISIVAMSQQGDKYPLNIAVAATCSPNCTLIIYHNYHIAHRFNCIEGYCQLNNREYTANVRFIREGFEKRVSRDKSVNMLTCWYKDNHFI